MCSTPEMNFLLLLYCSRRSAVLAIDVIRQSKLKKFVIFSDSLSGLQSVDGFNIDNDLVQKFIKEYSVQTKQGKTIALCWIPSYVGIPSFQRSN